MMTEEQWQLYHEVSTELGQEDVSLKSYDEYKAEMEKLLG